MTLEEAKKMEGTEFTYVFEDGDSIQAYVKKVNIESARMSCWSFSLITNEGYKFYPINEDEAKQNAKCVIFTRTFEDTIKSIKEIKKEGMYKNNGVGFFPGCGF